MTQLAQNGSTGSVVVRSAAPEPSGPGQDQNVNLFAVLHKLLRGRYLLLIILAGLGAAGGATAGYLIPTPKYRAEGTVVIKPVLGKILTDSTSVMPMFNNFVNTQAAYLQHEVVRTKVLMSDSWKSLKRPPGPQLEEEFQKNLKVVTSKDNDMISVTYTDVDGRAAWIAVKETIEAYQDRFGDSREDKDRKARFETLAQTRKGYETELKTIQERISQERRKWETSDLLTLETKSLQQYLDADDKLKTIKNRLLELGVDADKADTVKPPDGGVPANDIAEKKQLARTPAEIATVDPKMKSMINEQLEISSRIRQLQAKGAGEGNPAVIKAKEQLKLVEEDIKEAARIWNELHAPNAPAAAPNLQNESVSELRERYINLKQQVNAARIRTTSINETRITIDDKQREAKAIQEKLDPIVARLDALTIESRGPDGERGRIQTFVPDNPPAIPNADPRIKFAALGFVAGGGIPFALFLLLGILDRRVRYSDQAESPTISAPLLGILPQLPADLDDPEQIAGAVHCVHQIRTLLQLSGSERKVYAVTSPTAGDGKTSLALSLGLSFAASGRRTILVDFDLIGRGLSSRFKVEDAKGIGHGLISGNGELVPIETGIGGLMLLAAGRGDNLLVGRLPEERFEALLQTLRGSYDAIVIDTGPILGSLEASIAASHADGVILVVGRGQMNNFIKSSVDRLASLRAKLTGLVFNRATNSDFNRSAASTSFRSLSGPRLPTEPKPTPKALEHMDPLARCVARDTQP